MCVNMQNSQSPTRLLNTIYKTTVFAAVPRFVVYSNLILYSQTHTDKRSSDDYSFWIILPDLPTFTYFAYKCIQIQEQPFPP